MNSAHTPTSVTPFTNTGTALVLGASGGIGGEVARQLLAAGWQVRGLKRAPPSEAQAGSGIAWQRGDALDGAAVRQAAQGCQLIVHAVNPPGYLRWAELVLPMLEHSIAAAREQGACLLLPGTVYNYAPDAPMPLREDAPQQPPSRKGAIRVEMERRLQAASEAAERPCQVLIVRAGDFFGPQPGNSWFSQGLIQPGRLPKRVLLPATPGVGHQWAYLPDVARTMVALVQRRAELPAFASFHMAGHWDADGRQMGEAIQRVMAQHDLPTPRLRAFPWWLMRVLAPFKATLREMQEMRYLWRQPVRMDNARLRAVLGEEPHTPLDEAVAQSLRGLGCLPATSQSSPVELKA
ncbi:MAG: hypothetical protein CFE41_22300 [Burkholderiales bacterium PBB2]|nr:MAG: hypothetical protein CFE41_22300 [Burkholderiales bacterium PBB2]